MSLSRNCVCVCLLTISAASGCQSSSYTQRGTVLGGLGGAGIGALIGRATGHTTAGAAIGAGAGAVTGAAVGSGLDEIEARNRAEIAAQLGRDVDPGGATTVEVLEMTRAGVAPQLIINYVNSAGMMQPLTTQDVIYLRDQGVDANVVQAMLACRVVAMPPGYVRVVPQRQTVIIEDDSCGGPCCYPHVGFGYGYGCHCR